MATVISNDGQTRWERALKSSDSVLPASVDFVSGDFPPVIAFPYGAYETSVITPGMVLIGVVDSSDPTVVYVASPAVAATLEGVSLYVIGVAMSGWPSAPELGDVLVAIEGCFDPDLLTWDPTQWPTEADRLNAFNNSGSQNIILQKRIASAP
jgi:hypothetical protein